MFIFPDAVAKVLFQYPTTRRLHFVTQVLQFVGGKEQRYEISGAPLREWNLEPTLVGDAVCIKLTTFFEMVGGTSQPFTFTDPWDGTTYPVCYFEADIFTAKMTEQGRNAVQFTIIEGRV